MGGDKAPQSVIKGAHLVLKEGYDLGYFLCGDQKVLQKEICKYPLLESNSTIVHSDKVVLSSDKPSTALRSGKQSSMRMAIDLVKNKKAFSIISCGNTGALMAMSKIVLRPLVGIERPAIATIIPTMKTSCVFLDMGANSEVNADQLIQFAIMGNAFAKAALGISNPRIGVLNIGTEEIKGNDVIKYTHKILSEKYTNLNYRGYIEGDDILKGVVDVVVTDGFTGNVALKSIEGTAKLCKHILAKGFKTSLFSKMGYYFARKSLKKTFNEIDPRNYNGALFVGLNGISIKGHGNSDEVAFANAIKVAINLSENNINKKIIELLGSNEEN